MINGKNILITGGTGSFGKKFIEKVLKGFSPKKLVIYSRDELKQYELQQNYPGDERLRYFLGDVRDFQRLKMALEGIDIVIHAAAMKQVPASEYNPFEAVKTNIIGGQNVIDASIQTGVQRVVALSTDKAAAPVNLYGATKLVSDKLFIAANNYKGKKDIKLSVVRYGNVMWSRGSVIPLFMKQKDDGVLTITDKRMTRFSITLDQGVDFVLDSITKMWGGEIFVPKIPSYLITDVAKAIAPNSKLNEIGIRPGEKIHEEMITSTDSINCIEFDKYLVILPSTNLWDVERFRLESDSSPGKYCEDNFSYKSGSNSDFLGLEKLKELIKQNAE